MAMMDAKWPWTAMGWRRRVLLASTLLLVLALIGGYLVARRVETNRRLIVFPATPRQLRRGPGLLCQVVKKIRRAGCTRRDR